MRVLPLGCVLFTVVAQNLLQAANTLDILPAGTTASTLSADGTTVVGENASGGFRWTETGGLSQIVGAPGDTGQHLTADAVSADGTIIAGSYRDASNAPFNYIWNANTSVDVKLSDPAHESLTPRRIKAMSADGSVVAGNYSLSSVDIGFRWYTNTNQIVPIPGWPDSRSLAALSADGSSLCGIASFSHGFLYTDSTGFTLLTTSSSATERAECIPFGMSADGSTVVGRADHNTDDGDVTTTTAVSPFVRTSAGVVYLDAADGTATAASADGSIVVGGVGSNNNPEKPQRPFRWDQSHGLLYLDEQLVNAGVDLQGFIFSTPVAISGDGSTILGNGTDSNGIAHAWVAKIDTFYTPTPNATPSATTDSPANPTQPSQPVLETNKTRLVTQGDKITIRGAAHGNVSKITYRVTPSQKTGKATGSSAWHFQVGLLPGRNVVTIIALGTDGTKTRTKVVVIKH